MAYMKETLAAYKEEHPELSHKESFAAVCYFFSRFSRLGVGGGGGSCLIHCLESPPLFIL